MVGAPPSRRRSLATCALDLHYEDPLTPEPLVGPAALAGHVGKLRTGAPDARLEATGEILSDGRFVAAPARVLATHTGQFGEFPPSGRAIAVQAVLYCELDDDRTRLWRVRAFFDLYDAAIQLGVLPKPGSRKRARDAHAARVRPALTRYFVTVIVPVWPEWIVQM